MQAIGFLMAENDVVCGKYSNSVANSTLPPIVLSVSLRQHFDDVTCKHIKLWRVNLRIAE